MADVANGRVERRLAAILAADVAGYSRLSERDEEGTVARLRAHRQELIDPEIATHRGRLVKTTGDGLLVEFVSAIDALRCALAVQRGMAERNAAALSEHRMDLRIGINSGDVIVDGDDLLGDGVNVAARLEGLAAPGGICVSSRVREDAVGKVDVVFDDAGEQRLKNIERPVRVYRVGAGVNGLATGNDAPLALPDKPSIAVLPFANMSGDPEQEYFTDGISEDIITELSRFRSLFVIARNSSFTYKGKSGDVKQIGRELGVRYVLEGSIRRAANRVRVTAQLIDATSGSHIWAEKYDRVLEDIFAVQEEVTQAIVAAIAPHIEASEFERMRQVRPGNLGAYELAMRGWAAAWTALGDPRDRDSRDEALRCAREALAIDPRCSAALRTIAFAQWQNVAMNLGGSGTEASDEGLSAARLAIAIDGSDHSAYLWKGFLLHYSGQVESALADLRRAHGLNPNDAYALAILGYAEAMQGNGQMAIEHCSRALRLSPRSPVRYAMLVPLGWAYFSAGDYAKGTEAALRAIDEVPKGPMPHSCLAVNCVGAGDLARAQAEIQVLRKLAPEFLESRLAGGAFGSTEIRKRLTTFLRVAAGLEDPSAADALR